MLGAVTLLAHIVIVIGQLFFFFYLSTPGMCVCVFSSLWPASKWEEDRALSLALCSVGHMCVLATNITG